jgi:L-2-hydroxyglutarate oxidase LhgO
VKRERCGKVIVALNDAELPALDRIYERGQQNGVECHYITSERLRELEPHVAGIKALHVPETSGAIECGSRVELLAVSKAPAACQLLPRLNVGLGPAGAAGSDSQTSQ